MHSQNRMSSAKNEVFHVIDIAYCYYCYLTNL